ncbi:protein IMPACT-like [Thrips palmi]|uniref:Protein IMPACT-like n=1 Tax=Thrips palmi TaxID=161013 RepID=A0A6P8YCT6_THRPL|nr:protein IMPACT-like [Thrips palmi]
MEDSAGDNIGRQIEEQEVLKSIYGEEWKQEVAGGSISLSEGSLGLELFITLTDAYPGEGPPLFQILAPCLTRDEMIQITNFLQDIYLDNLGETVIYQWIEKAREWLQNTAALRECAAGTSSEEAVMDSDSPEYLDDADGWNDKYTNSEKKIPVNVPSGPEIIHGDPISFKKSTFQGHVACITSTDQVKIVLSTLMENKKIANATHNMYAYRIFREDTKSFSQDCDDDGETQAGSRLLHLLQIMDARNILVVISRWYGGVHLGPDRFRLINNAARQVIEKAGLLPSQDKKH